LSVSAEAEADAVPARGPERHAIATAARGTACRRASDRTPCSRRPTAVRLSASSASHSTPPADSAPFPLPSPLASLARSPVEAKCCSIRSSLPRTVVLPSPTTTARRRPLFLHPRRTRDAHVRLLGHSAESLSCRPKPIPFRPEALSAVNRHLGTPERGPRRHPRNPLSSQTRNGASLGRLCLSSTSPVNLGLPSSAILPPSSRRLRR
jgi:hypothetical protein